MEEHGNVDNCFDLRCVHPTVPASRYGESFTLTYDAENRLVSVSGAATASFVYDGDGRRVKATVNGVTSYYVGDHYEVSGGVVKKYYSAGGRRIALRSGGTLAWLLGDHLGGTAVTVSGTAETGEVRYGSNSSWGRRCGYYLPQP